MRRAVVISGVGQGFGRSLALNLVESYHVIGITQTESHLETLREKLMETGQSFELLLADISDFKVTRRKLEAVLTNSAHPLYGLINNAGIRWRQDFDLIDLEDMRHVADVNLFGAVSISQACLPYMSAGGEGRIINISSIISLQALPALSAYSVSKAGLDAFTRSLAVELAPRHINVNSVLPGFCKTSYHEKFSQNTELFEMTLDRIPLGYWGEEDELIGICEFLLSKGARYITGASIPVDGGWLA